MQRSAMCKCNVEQMQADLPKVLKYLQDYKQKD